MEVVQQGGGTRGFRGCISEQHKPTCPEGLLHQLLSWGPPGASRPSDAAGYSPLWRPRRQQSSLRAELPVIHQSSTLYRKTRGQRLESPWTHSQWPSWLVRGLAGANLEAWGETGLGRGVWMTQGRRHKLWRLLHHMLILPREHLWGQTLHNPLAERTDPSLSSVTPDLRQCMRHRSHICRAET